MYLLQKKVLYFVSFIFVIEHRYVQPVAYIMFSILYIEIMYDRLEIEPGWRSGHN